MYLEEFNSRTKLRPKPTKISHQSQYLIKFPLLKLNKTIIFKALLKNRNVLELWWTCLAHRKHLRTFTLMFSAYPHATSCIERARYVVKWTIIATSFPGSFLFLPRWSTLVTCLCIQIKFSTGVGLLLNCVQRLYGGESCLTLQTLFWKILRSRDPAWPVLHFYPNFYEYEMLISREACLFSLPSTPCFGLV